jgi:hypothetical protein
MGFPIYIVNNINNWAEDKNKANAIEILFIISACHYSSPYLEKKTTMQFLEKNTL